MSESDLDQFQANAGGSAPSPGETRAEEATPSWDLARLRRQDADEFTRLVHQHERLVMGLGQSLGLRGPDLDDAAAIAFAEVYRALPRFEGRARLSTFIYQIAARSMTKSRHRFQRNRAASDLSTSQEVADPASCSPGRELAERETQQQLWEAVAGLEPRQAMAVELYYRRDTTLEEIAAILGCPVGTVKTLLFRAREQLRGILMKKEMQR